MKTAEQLEARVQELGRQMADYSRQAIEIRSTDTEQSRLLMRQAYEAGKRSRVLIAELLRNQ